MKFSSLDDLRRFGARLVLGLVWLIALIACAAAASLQPHWQGLAGTAFALALIATVLGRGGKVSGRLILSAILMAQVSILVAAHNGNAWQIDMHMTYFAALAIVSVMCDWRAIAAATLVVALHHLTLSFILPALVFPGSASLERVAIHAVILTVEAAALVWSSLNIATMFAVSKDALGKAETALAQAETASAELVHSQEAQQQVVAEISHGMRRLSEGDLSASIETPFAGTYESLRGDFNDTVAQMRTARAAEAAAREAEEIARRQRAEEQNLVVSKITDGMGRLSQGDFSVEINDAFPESYDALRVNFNAAAAQLRTARAASLEAGKAQESVVHSISTAMKSLAAGDLTVAFNAPFPTGYEQVRSDLNAAFASLRAVFADVVAVAQSIRSGAADLSDSAVHLSRRSGEQAATVEETAAALNEITEGLQRTAKLGDTVMNSISAARENSERSNAIAAEVVGAVEAIADSSNQIAKINGVIRDIAFQTNLLALNAGVEAARAGDAGRGFAIVAQEVGALANRAADAAKEINTLIASSKISVEKGVDLVARSGQSVAEVIQRIGEVEKVAAAISRATAEQAATLGQVNQSVSRIDSATQQNAAMSEDTQNSSSALSENADALNNAVGRFKVGGGDARRRAVA